MRPVLSVDSKLEPAETPLFSVVLTTHNRSALLPTAIGSVLVQEHQDFELVIVDDASEDDTPEILSSCTDRRVVIRRNNQNMHKGASRNVGITAARGQYVCFLDDDDYYRPNHLSVLSKELQARHYPVALLFTLAVEERAGGKHPMLRYLPPIGSTDPVAYLFDRRYPVGTPQTCIHAAVLRQERFNERIRTGQDTELFMRIAVRYPIIRIEAGTFVAVRHQGSSAHNRNNGGLERLRGYKYIWADATVRRRLPWRLRFEMVSYCLLRMAEHYEFVGRRLPQAAAALASFAMAPWDSPRIRKLVLLVYALPGGAVLRRSVRRLKRIGLLKR